MLTDKEVEKIATLARIELKDSEREKFKTEMSSILSYVGILNKAGTEKVEPLMQVTDLVNSVRDDAPRDEFPMNEKSNALLINQAPDKKERFIKVKSILKKNGK